MYVLFVVAPCVGTLQCRFFNICFYSSLYDLYGLENLLLSYLVCCSSVCQVCQLMYMVDYIKCLTTVEQL